MKTFNVIYKKRSSENRELFFMKVQAENEDWAFQQVNKMDKDYYAVSIASSTFIKLYKKYTKLYNKIISKSKDSVHVFGHIDRFLNEISFPNEHVFIFRNYIICENLTPTGIYIADYNEFIELYEISDYTLLQLVEWLDPIVNIALKGVKLDELGE